MTAEPTHRTARARARAQITDELLAAARRQMANVGPGALSLRSVARELGMVSSAVYRYFDSRDALLTRLIVDAYDDLGAVAEAAAAPPGNRADTGSVGTGGDAARWVATARALRNWAHAHPHEYALLYGSPVPGYAAPDDTVGPGIRVSLALVDIVADAAAAGRLAPPTPGPPLPGPLAADLIALTDQIAAVRSGADLTGTPDRPGTSDANRPDAGGGAELSAEATLALLTAWTQLFGLLSFEMFHQTRNMVSDDGALFDAAAARMAHDIGLR